jgi:hypothetical protein
LTGYILTLTLIYKTSTQQSILMASYLELPREGVLFDGKNRAIWAKLPIELVLHILEVCAWDFPHTRLSLCTISQAARGVVTPILYTNVVVRGSTSLLLLTESAGSLALLQQHAKYVTFAASAPREENEELFQYTYEEHSTACLELH